MSKVRWTQFRLRTLLAVMTIASVVFALLAARYPTVRQFNDAGRNLEQIIGAIKWRTTGVSGSGQRAGFFQAGRFQDRYSGYSGGGEFDIVVEGRESKFFNGEPIVEITWAESVGSRRMAPERSREICFEIKEQLSVDVLVVVKSQDLRVHSIYDEITRDINARRDRKGD